MGLSKEQHRLIVETWPLIAGDDNGAGVGKDMLVRHLQEHPELQTVFGYAAGPWDPANNESVVELGRKVMAQVGTTVSQLDDEAKMVSTLKALGDRHKNYGDRNLKAEYFGPLGGTLLWAVEKRIGDKMTPATKEAWGAAYGAISGAIIAGIQS